MEIIYTIPLQKFQDMKSFDNPVWEIFDTANNDSKGKW